ncbi:YwqG family protein [Phenylobacterium sp.]|uniref:YwqG family protein n=1 Tax=Phenylobacterium sp. TaxID=1871053 RepID=UPI0028118078|nr:YwqG family protein [Phenylobacterium sp.]
MTTAPELVRTLLLASAAAFSGLLVLAAFIGVVILIAPRVPKRSRAPGRKPRLESEDAVRLARRMRRNKLTTVLLKPVATPSFSKIGGAPDMPTDWPWPEGPEGALRFFCQLDLQAVRDAGGPEWLPPTGRLYVFHDDRFGAADQVRMMAGPEAAVAVREPPSTSAWPYRERRIAFLGRPSLPSLHWLDLSGLDLRDEELDVLSDLADLGSDGPEHRLGGYPSEIQSGQMQVACERIARGLPESGAADEAARRAARRWRLLLQIDTDPELGVEFGDGGRLYVFVAEQDARVGDFSRTVTLYQTY